MVEIVSVGHTGITNFNIGRGTGDPTASFQVEYYPCDGVEEEPIQSGDIIHLLLSDPKYANQYQDIFKGRIDIVETVYNNQGEGYSIQGRDLAACMAYQKYTLYDGLPPETSAGGAFLGGNKDVDLWDYVLEIMEDTGLTTLKTSLGPGGEMEFSSTERWNYRTDAAEVVDDVEYEEGEWHSNHKIRTVVQRQEGTKVDALNEILNNAIGIGSHLGKYGWYVDKGGALVIFRIDKPSKILQLHTDMMCVEEIRVRDDSTGVTNGIQGYGHDKTVKVTEPAETTKIECYLKDEDSIDRFGLREAPTVENPDLSQDELELTCKNSFSPNEKYTVSVVMNNYSDINPSTALQFPGINKISGKLFTVTDYHLIGNPGDYQTTLDGEIWSKVVAKPTPYQSLKTIARMEAERMRGVPVNVVGVDYEGSMVRVMPSNGKKPYWVRYLRR